ncbi:MAG: hypothetical protein HY337_09045, partial [Gemmatimonadetes bacterium]|nr:hypothetical protein [Gemmatimonadota bacterium]
MARALGLKPFYALLGAIAVAGAAWLYLSARNDAQPAMAEPLSVGAVAAAAAFPGYTLGSDSAPVEVIEY